MLNNTFEYSVKNCIRDTEGRYIILEISIINLITFFIINVYAPNKDEPEWFNNLFNIMEPISNNYEIWTGDWNAALSDNDIYNYTTLRNPFASQTINNFISKMV